MHRAAVAFVLTASIAAGAVAQQDALTQAQQVMAAALSGGADRLAQSL